MNLLKRIAVTVHSGIERSVSSMENHQALVDAALKESRDVLVSAKVRLSKLETDIENQQNRITELAKEIELWGDRAAACAVAERERALSCLRRKKSREQDLEMAKAQLAKQKIFSQRAHKSINETANRVNVLHHQRNQMRSRQTIAEAGKKVATLDDRFFHGVDVVLENWEIKVSQTEAWCEDQCFAGSDELEESFLLSEEREALEHELDQLTRQGHDVNG